MLQDVCHASDEDPIQSVSFSDPSLRVSESPSRVASSEAVMRHIPEAQKITDIGRAVGLLLRTHKPSQTHIVSYCTILYLAPNDCNLNVYGLYRTVSMDSNHLKS